MATLFNALDTGNKVLSTGIGALVALKGAFSDDMIQQLHWIEGVLMIGETWTPRGISDIFGYYAKAVGVAINGLENISKELTIKYADSLSHDKLSENELREKSRAFWGAESIIFSREWLKANSTYFKTILK